MLVLNTSSAFSQARSSSTMLNSEEFIKMGNLANTRYRITHDKQLNVVFLGGSITNMDGWRAKVSAYLQAKYPDVTITCINAGIPSLGSLPHVFRFKHDVLDKGRVDLLFIESAVNDHVNGTPVLVQQRALEGIIRHARAVNKYTDIVMMAFVDEDKIANYRNGRLPAEVGVHATIAARYQLSFINLAEEVTRRIDRREFTWEHDFKDLHPSPFGQELYFNTIRQLLEKQLSAKAPSQLVSYTLPAPADRLNYSNGDYMPVGAAEQLSGFVLHPHWQPADKTATREGFTEVPMLVADKAGASFTLPFDGNAVGISIISGPDAGIIEYRIDNGPILTKDLYTQWSAGLHLPWYLLLGDDLKAGRHQLWVKMSVDKNELSKGNACRVVHFLVNKRHKSR
jgi:lysophospholipase L1-like esterase